MNDYLTLVALSATVASSVAGAAAWFARKYIESRIEMVVQQRLDVIRHGHAKELAILQSSLEFGNEKRSEILNKQLDVLRDLAELVYRGRNLARSLVHLDRKLAPEEFPNLLRSLQESLYKGIIFLDNELFLELHAYKGLLVSLHSIPELPLDVTKRKAEIKEFLWPKIDHAYLDLVSAIRNRLEAVGEVQRTGENLLREYTGTANLTPAPEGYRPK